VDWGVRGRKRYRGPLKELLLPSERRRKVSADG
jgi:hypothetical protein